MPISLTPAFAVNIDCVPVGNAGNAAANSFYGTFDQGGNVYERNDAVISGSSRGLRGGSWNNNEDNLRPASR